MSSSHSDLSSAARVLLDRYAQELERWGQRINLVGSTDRRALDRHFREALAAAPSLSQGARVVDLGSGAGLPGLPLAIARPDVEVVLVELRERRAHFLRHVVRVLSLPVRVERRSIEDPPRGAARFDVACMRAVAPPVESLEKGRLWVLPEGEVWIWTADRAALPSRDRVGEIGLGERGWILRAHASEVSRGTPR